MDRLFTRIASTSATLMGQPLAFIVSTLLVVVWAVSGPFFDYSDTWQLVINTATTVLTFLAVFLIQNSQNRDGAAIQAKLDEVIRALDKAREQFIGIEHLTDSQIEDIRAALEREVGKEPGKSRTADDTVDDVLFQRLRALRRTLADGEGVPAYIVFSDAVLTRMAAMRPVDEAGLLARPGIGPAKLARYGNAFLRVLRDDV